MIPFGLGLLGIVTRDDRRGFHDRRADTDVVPVDTGRRPLVAARSQRIDSRAMPDGGSAEATQNGIEVENPATGETIATVPDLGVEEVRAIAAAARAAQPGWEALGFDGRAEVLLAANRWMVANGERVVGTIVAETGKPVDETQLAELSYGLSALEFWAKKAPPTLPTRRSSRRRRSSAAAGWSSATRRSAWSASSGPGTTR